MKSLAETREGLDQYHFFSSATFWEIPTHHSGTLQTLPLSNTRLPPEAAKEEHQVLINCPAHFR